MKNTEQLVVYKDKNGIYYNQHLAIAGTARDMRKYAKTHNYTRGVICFVGVSRTGLLFCKV